MPRSRSPAKPRRSRSRSYGRENGRRDNHDHHGHHHRERSLHQNGKEEEEEEASIHRKEQQRRHRSRSRSRDRDRDRDRHHHRSKDDGRRHHRHRSSRDGKKDKHRHKDKKKEASAEDGRVERRRSPHKKPQEEKNEEEKKAGETRHKSPPKSPKKRAISLSFDDEMAEEEAAAVPKRKGLEEATSERMKAERIQAMRVISDASLARAVLPPQLQPHAPAPTTMTSSSSSTAGVPAAASSLQMVDDEVKVVLANDSENLQPEALGPVCLAKGAATRGPKADMEDTHVIVASLTGGGGEAEDAFPVSFYGVYDGHCGAMAAELAASHLHTFLAPRRHVFLGGPRDSEEERAAKAKAALEEAYKEMEAMIMQRLKEDGRRQDGSAAVTAVVARNRLYIANVGDCRAVLASQTPDGRVAATRLSVDHKPDLEHERVRIRRAGGSVEFSGVWRVAHNLIPIRLAVSRAFGDPLFKRPFGAGASSLLLRRHSSGRGVQEEEPEDGDDELSAPTLPGFQPLVSAVPDVATHVLTRDDLFLILASDGIWDTMTDPEAVAFVCEVFQRHQMLGNAEAPFTETVVKEAADCLINTALTRGAYDNCTVVLVAFQVQ